MITYGKMSVVICCPLRRSRDHGVHLFFGHVWVDVEFAIHVRTEEQKDMVDSNPYEFVRAGIRRA